MKNYFTSLIIMALSVVCLGQDGYNPKILKGQKQDIVSEYMNKGRIPAQVLNAQHQWQLKSSQTLKLRLDSTILETIEDLEDWMFEGKDIMNYDEKNFCSEYISYSYNNSSGYYLSSKMEFFSEDDINLTRVTLYDWEKNENAWEIGYKVEYEYYNSGLLKQYITFLWDEGSKSWNMFQKSGSIYNEKGQLFVETYSEFDKGTETWADYMKTEFIFNSEWLKTGNTVSVYSKDEKQWFATKKNEFFYNSNGVLTTSISYNRNFISGEWEKNSKEENIFDSQNNLNSLVYLHWDEDNDKWINNWKNDYVYNNAYLFEELLVPVFFIINNSGGINFGHIVIESSSHEWDKSNSTWKQLSRETSYYSSLNTTGISTNRHNDFKIFPNPAQGKFKVQSSKFRVENANIEIYNLTGKKVIQKQIVAGNEIHEIDTYNLQNGVYFCKVFIGKQSITKKLIIQK